MADRARFARATVLVGCAVLVASLLVAPASSFAGPAVNYPPIPARSDNPCLGLKKPSPPLSSGQMDMIQQQLIKEHPRDIDSGGSCPGGPVTVQLRTGREWLARELEGQYGSKLAIFVGLTAWHGHPGRSPVCGDVPVVPQLRHRVYLQLRLNTPAVASGSDFAGTVTLTNEGSSSFSTNIGQPLEAVLVKAGSRRVVGVYVDGIAGTGLLVKLAPGRSARVKFVGGTARCDGGVGSALPAGEYGVTVLVMDETYDFPGGSTFSAYVSASRPLRVLAS